MFKKASWLLALLLGALLFYAWSQVPTQGDSPLTLHLSNRYIQKAETETGIHSPAGAVAGDYRGFDLFASGFLFSLSALCLLLFWPRAPRVSDYFPAIFWLGGAVLTLGLGFFTLFHGSNFLDYEALGLIGNASQARLNGVLFLSCGVLLSLGGLILMLIQWVRVPEVSNER